MFNFSGVLSIKKEGEIIYEKKIPLHWIEKKLLVKNLLRIKYN